MRYDGAFEENLRLLSYHRLVNESREQPHRRRREKCRIENDAAFRTSYWAFLRKHGTKTPRNTNIFKEYRISGCKLQIYGQNYFNLEHTFHNQRKKTATTSAILHAVVLNLWEVLDVVKSGSGRDVKRK